MGIQTELAEWGEAPSTSTERALGVLVDKVLNKLASGRSVRGESVRAGRPELVASGRELIQAINLLHECAASVWESSLPEQQNEAGKLHGHSTLTPPFAEPYKSDMGTLPPAQHAQDVALPDPFPGEFRIRRLLGEGNFGKVWLADDLHLPRQVALKTLKIPPTATLWPQVLAALQKEAQHLATLDHPNIVRVYAWREAQGEHYLVLQYVAGGSLAAKLKEAKRLDWQDAGRYIADVGEALVEAHRRGVIHRDIKPDNVLLDAERDEAILTDFGISARLTEPGAAAGSPAYMAPEAFDGHVSPALDVYSLAATFFRLVTGKLPFGNGAANMLFDKLQGLPAPDPRCKDLPDALEQIIRAGLAAKPEHRPSTTDFVARLRGALNQHLADALATPKAKNALSAPVNLRLTVSRRVSDGTYHPVAATARTFAVTTRDMKKVPRPPDQVSLRTGDRVRIEVVADKTGYLTVFSIGPTGNLNLLYPDETTTPPLVEANRSLDVADVEMTPPVGRERLFAVWSRDSFPLRDADLVSLAQRLSRLTSTPSYQATRDMKKLKITLERMPRDKWQAVVLELDHFIDRREDRLRV